MISDRQSPKCKHAPYVNNFDFDLTDLEINEIRFHSAVLAGLSNAVWILKIGQIISEIEEDHNGHNSDFDLICNITGRTEAYVNGNLTVPGDIGDIERFAF